MKNGAGSPTLKTINNKEQYVSKKNEDSNLKFIKCGAVLMGYYKILKVKKEIVGSVIYNLQYFV